MSTISSVQLNNSPVFKESNVNKTISEDVSSDLVKSPDADEFKSEAEAKPKKKRNLAGKIALGVISAIALTYGGVVLHRKLSKPTFEEVQKCFKEIFQKDLSTSEVKELIEKYKQICKNKDKEEFIQQMTKQLKKDYGLEQVVTELEIKNDILKKNTKGTATPLGKIEIIPNIYDDTLFKYIQCDIFTTAFHELKHIKQYAEAYRASPEKFAEAIFNNVINLNPEAKADLIESDKQSLREIYNKIKQGDKETIEYLKLNKKDLEERYLKYNTEYLIELHYKEFGLNSEKDIFNFLKSEEIKRGKKLLEKRYGKLEQYKENTKEYKKGIEYIKAWEDYPNPDENYRTYRNNLLEKEAWDVGEQAQKIYKYMSSIWKI